MLYLCVISIFKYTPKKTLSERKLDAVCNVRMIPNSSKTHTQKIIEMPLSVLGLPVELLRKQVRALTIDCIVLRALQSLSHALWAQKRY